MSASRDELAAEVVRVCRRLDARGLIAGPDGNVSAMIDEQTLLITPGGMSKGRCGVDDLVQVRVDGRVETTGGRPSTELAMHLRIYARRADVRAIVHAHPPVATAFGVAGEGFTAPVLPEIILQMGVVPLVPYGQTGAGALADQMEPYVADHDAFLLANHGATTVGPTLEIALQRMESLEHAACILFAARQLGRVNELTAEQARALHTIRSGTRREPAAAPSVDHDHHRETSR